MLCYPSVQYDDTGMPAGKTFEAESFNLTVEKNKFLDDPSNEMNAKDCTSTFAEAITIQGPRTIRGNSHLGVRRESRDVFGILTKGTRDNR